jgi:hypothetical protein
LNLVRKVSRVNFLDDENMVNKRITLINGGQSLSLIENLNSNLLIII